MSTSSARPRRRPILYVTTSRTHRAKAEWHPYQESSDDSGIAAYSLFPKAIAIVFKHGGTYLYSHAAPGRDHVASMKKLALAGDGLNTYINQHVRDNYERKIG